MGSPTGSVVRRPLRALGSASSVDAALLHPRAHRGDTLSAPASVTGMALAAGAPSQSLAAAPGHHIRRATVSYRTTPDAGRGHPTGEKCHAVGCDFTALSCWDHPAANRLASERVHGRMAYWEDQEIEVVRDA